MNPILFIQSDLANSQPIVDTMANVAAQSVEKITLWDLTLKGGWIMVVLAAFLILAVYIFIERYLTLRKAVKSEADNTFMSNIRQYIHQGNVEGARTLAALSF